MFSYGLTAARHYWKHVRSYPEHLPTGERQHLALRKYNSKNLCVPVAALSSNNIVSKPWQHKKSPAKIFCLHHPRRDKRSQISAGVQNFKPRVCRIVSYGLEKKSIIVMIWKHSHYSVTECLGFSSKIYYCKMRLFWSDILNIKPNTYRFIVWAKSLFILQTVILNNTQHCTA